MHTNDTDMRICRSCKNYTVTSRDNRLRMSRAARERQPSDRPAAYAPRAPRRSITRRLDAPPAHTSATAATPARWLAAASRRCHWSTWARVIGSSPRASPAAPAGSVCSMGDRRPSPCPRRPRARDFFIRSEQQESTTVRQSEAVSMRSRTRNGLGDERAGCAPSI